MTKNPVGMDGIIPYALMEQLAGEVENVAEMIEALGSGFTVKGVVAATTDLPGSGELGDLYLVSGEGYASYVWDGDSWELKDGDIATNAEIDSALYS